MVNFALLLFAALLIGTTSAKGSKSTKPNFVIFLSDDVGIGDIGCYGNTSLKTPNLDRMSREGARLTHHLASAGLCTPSRAAFMTGRYQTRSGMAAATHGVRVNLYLAAKHGLPAEEVTMAEVVKEKDYATGYIGKWHLGLHGSNSKDFAKHPMKQGFDYYFGAPLTNLKDFGEDSLNTITSAFPWVDTQIVVSTILAVSFVLLLKFFGFNKTVTTVLLVLALIPGPLIFFYVHNIKLLNSLLMKGYEVVEQPIKLRANLTQRLAGEAVHFLEQHQSEPFFLMVGWLQVHTVMHTSKEFEGHSGHSEYGDNIEEMDWGVGHVLDALDRLGLADNTLVYFSSDHGGHSQEVDAKGKVVGGYNGIYRGTKTQGGWEGGIRVVGLVRYPPLIKQGTVIDAVTSHMDVFETVADLSGGRKPSDRQYDGHSMVPLLSGKTKESSHDVLVHLCGTQIHAARYVKGDDVWKVHFATPRWIPNQDHCGFACQCLAGDVWYHDPPLFFNIAKDPSERSPLNASDPQYKGILTHINKKVEEYKASLKPVEDQFSLVNMLPRPWLQPYCSLPFLSCRD